MAIAMLVGCGGSSGPGGAPVNKTPEALIKAREYYFGLERLNKQVTFILDQYTKVVSPGFQGKAVNKASVETAYETQQKALEGVVAEAKKLTPDSASAKALNDATTRYWEGTLKRLPKLKEVGLIAADPKLTADQKKAKADPIFDEMKKEEGPEEAAMKEAEQKFLAEFKVR